MTKLLTKTLLKKFKKYPLYSQDGKRLNAEVVVKFLDPFSSATWLITEGESQGNDFIMYGYCYIHEWEWGYVSLNELESIGRIERDLYSTGLQVKDLV